ncbi:MAG: hypothetical protein HY423_03660 [Candidatus Lambdaproteobacteria bacterium]|nr:hypothetical protein [Candidatus Lambdaproteobacteria bacterium]
MLLLEHEGKALLAAHRVPVPRGLVVRSPAEVDWARLAYPVAVKAQVAAGGRGKAGGVVRADGAVMARAAAERLLSATFNGAPTEAVLVEAWLAIERELYLSVVVDGEAEGYSVLYAPRGGVDVEAGPPPARYPVGPPEAFRSWRLREELAPVEPDGRLREQVVTLGRRLLELAVAQDCLQVEVNPLALLQHGGLMAADVRLVLDEAAAHRSALVHGHLRAAQARESDPVRRCLEGRLMLVPLDGNVGLISGGAGMTMAAMDLIQAAGGRPAGFLDCSNNPTPQGYRLAFELLDADPAVRVILVSIFGGATDMERVARTMRTIMGERRAAKPVVFRLNGTYAERIPGVFAEAGLHNHPTLEEAVGASVRIASEAA